MADRNFCLATAAQNFCPRKLNTRSIKSSAEKRTAMPSEVFNSRVFRSLEAMSGEMLGNAIVFDFKKIFRTLTQEHMESEKGSQSKKWNVR